MNLKWKLFEISSKYVQKNVQKIEPNIEPRENLMYNIVVLINNTIQKKEGEKNRRGK